MQISCDILSFWADLGLSSYKIGATYHWCFKLITKQAEEKNKIEIHYYYKISNQVDHINGKGHCHSQKVQKTQLEGMTKVDQVIFIS